MRLKFLYPNGDVEILDCTWVAVATLTPNGQEAQAQWVVVHFEGREIWKPLGCLIQAEVIGQNHASDGPTEGVAALDGEEFGYHR